jgi:putative flavoprotein involved in K+ transport
MEHVAAVVVGAGHAGLAMSNLLRNDGVEHIVFERGRIAERWRNQRWDSFTLLTPNWATWLPNFRYDGNEPDGFMPRDEVVDYFERYARSFDAPVREGVEVTSLEADGDGYRLQTSAGEYRAGTVVVATGSFQAPKTPAWAGQLPPEIIQLHSSGYRSPDQFPAGAVVVVGSGASGQQIVEDFTRAGREVYLCVGSNSSVPRRYRGHDFLWWMEHGGWYEKTADDVPADKRYGGVSHSLTGYGGGHYLDLRVLHAQGATLLGRALGTRDGKLQLGTGLAESVAAGDRAYDEFVAWVEDRIVRFEGAFDEPDPRPVLPDPPEAPTELDLSERGVVGIVWATGFSPDYARWIHLPVFDANGQPVHRRGATAAPNL